MDPILWVYFPPPQKSPKNNKKRPTTLTSHPFSVELHPPRFTTFTQADLALRRRAAEMDGEINRQRYAERGEEVHSVEA